MNHLQLIKQHADMFCEYTAYLWSQEPCVIETKASCPLPTRTSRNTPMPQSHSLVCHASKHSTTNSNFLVIWWHISGSYALLGVKQKDWFRILVTAEMPLNNQLSLLKHIDGLWIIRTYPWNFTNSAKDAYKWTNIVLMNTLTNCCTFAFFYFYWCWYFFSI
jgi:hypothetical protein